MANRAFLFPGQGSQAVGMAKALSEAFPAARQLLQEVDDTLSQKLSRLMFEGPEGDLTLTENAQPALMAASLAVVRVVEAESGRKLAELADYVAGHSLGEYSALAAVGALTVADAARLLKLRGQAMQKAVPAGEGGMVALLGAELELAREIATAAAGGQVLDIANDNGGGQVVLSGAAEAVARAVTVAGEKGVRRAVVLPVSAPFHCRLMQPAADVMRDALDKVAFLAPSLPVVANVTAEPSDSPDALRDQLVTQVTGMVRWRESMERMAALGVADFVELGAGKVLTGLGKRIVKDATARAIGGPEDLDGLLKSL